MKKLILIFLIFLSLAITQILASTGDNSPYYSNCVNTCKKTNCQNNVLLYKKGMEDKFVVNLMAFIKLRNFEIKTFENMITWNCRDECKYQCMQKTTEAFMLRKWKVPQFHGKWPFVRFLGIQEPASVFFSALNFFVHYKGLMQFRQEVKADSPFYKLWHAYSIICLNAWTWSCVFHTRDYHLTELFDYVFAYSMVLASFWCMIIRVTHGKSKKVSLAITTLCVFYFLNHFAYLSFNKFDYTYNMKVNIITGVAGGSGWITWCLSQIRKRFYVWKLLLFVILALASVALEVYDFPPILWAFDAHSLWHLSSAPITILFYKFIIDDCNALRKEALSDDQKKLI